MIGNYYLLVAGFGNRIRKWPLRKGLGDDAGIDSWTSMKRDMDKCDIQSSISIIKHFSYRGKVCLTELLSFCEEVK